MTVSHQLCYNGIRIETVQYLDWVEVGGHDDLVERPSQFGGQFGFPLQPLGPGEILQPRQREEVVDHCHTVMLA